MSLASRLIQAGFRAKDFKGVKSSRLRQQLEVEWVGHKIRFTGQRLNEQKICDARNRRIKPDREALFWQSSAYSKYIYLWVLKLNISKGVAWTESLGFTLERDEMMVVGKSVYKGECTEEELRELLSHETPCISPYRLERRMHPSGPAVRIWTTEYPRFPRNYDDHAGPCMFNSWDIWITGEHTGEWRTFIESAGQPPLFELAPDGTSDRPPSKATQNFFQMTATASAINQTITRN